MLINKKITLQTLIEYDYPISQSLKIMDQFGIDSVKISKFESLLKSEIDRIYKIHKDSHNVTTLLEKVKKVYSITNLKKNNIIIVDDGDNSLSFVSHIHDMFSDLLDSFKVKPITDRELLSHLKYIKSLLNDSKSFHSYSDIERKTFLEDIQTFLRKVRQDLDKNQKVIIARAENLSAYFEDDSDTGINKNKVMQEIVNLCEVYVEPFHSFLENYNQSSFIYQLRRLRRFFAANELPEEDQISRFTINFISYKKDIQLVYDKINDYRRRGQKDLIFYNAFETEFNHLNEVILSLQDGKQIKNHIESSDYHLRFPKYENLKVKNTFESNISIDYEMMSERFFKVEEQLLIDMDIDIEDNENSPISNNKRDSISPQEIKEAEARKEFEDFHNSLELRITNVINKNIGYISKENGQDILYKVHRVLSKNIDEYKISHAIFGYLIARDSIETVTVLFNERKRLEVDHQFYKYRPIYAGKLINE